MQTLVHFTQIIILNQPRDGSRGIGAETFVMLGIDGDIHIKKESLRIGWTEKRYLLANFLMVLRRYPLIGIDREREAKGGSVSEKRDGLERGV